jgi:hypothetical protein
LRIARLFLPVSVGAFVGSALASAQAASVLQGLERLYVQVSHISDTASAGGVDAAVFVRDTSLMLSRAGLVVLSVESPLPDTPFVSLALDALELPAGEIVFHASLELQEAVLPTRNPGVSTVGSTWYSSRFGLCHPTALPDDLLAAVQSMTDEFLAEWAATVPGP